MYTVKIHFRKELSKRQVYSCWRATMYSFFLNMYKENSKGCGLACVLSYQTLFSPPCSGHSGVKSFMQMCSTKEDWFVFRPQPVPILLRPRICFLAASGPVVEAHCQFRSNTRALPLFSSGLISPAFIYFHQCKILKGSNWFSFLKHERSVFQTSVFPKEISLINMCKN